MTDPAEYKTSTCSGGSSDRATNACTSKCSSSDGSHGTCSSLNSLVLESILLANLFSSELPYG
jgi:hypothetical protein